MDNLSTGKGTPTFGEGLERVQRDGKQATAQASEAMNQQMQAATETARGVSSEMLRYAGQRLHAHAEHLQNLAQCQTPQSVMEQQMAFMRSSAQQFSQGISSLFAASQRASSKQAS